MEASPEFAQSLNSLVGSSFTLSHKRALTEQNKHYCLQIICSCRFCWGRMGPQSLREASDFQFITVGRLMKQTHRGYLGRYLQLYFIFTTNTWKLYHGVHFLHEYWFQSIAVCGESSLSHNVCNLQRILASVMLHLQFSYLPGCIVRNVMMGLFHANCAFRVCCFLK